MKVLDCTLRDGGYYNSWHFSKNIIKKYLNAVSLSGIDMVEIGFRSYPKESFLGSAFYSTDKFLSILDIKNHGNTEIGVMIDAKEVKADVKKCINGLFCKKDDSIISFVRIATHLDDAKTTAESSLILKELGYKVCINLMQISERSLSDLQYFIKFIQKNGQADVLYFADSLGNLCLQKTKEIIESIQGLWRGNIGIHAHDNKNNALLNSLYALENGVDYVDSTVLGMGRGAGNTKTELLLLELQKRGFSQYKPEYIFDIVLNDFSELQKKYKWGYSIFYYLAAEYGIHPTYIQQALTDLSYSPNDVLRLIQFLKKKNSCQYSLKTINEFSNGENIDFKGSWNANNWVEKKDVLVLGTSGSCKTYNEDIEIFIKEKKPIVINLNSDPLIEEDLIDIYAICNPIRVESELYKCLQYKKNILIPYKMINENIAVPENVLDYGIEIKSGVFHPMDDKCIIPHCLVAFYVFASCIIGGCSSIYIAGFDGYEMGAEKQVRMIESLEYYNKCYNKVDLISLTPTTYPIKQSSVYRYI